MKLNIVKEGNGYVHRNEDGRMVAEITFHPKENGVIVADHTYVDPELRGQGVAEKLLDHLVSEAEANGQKIEALCSYVAQRFETEPDKFDYINAKVK